MIAASRTLVLAYGAGATFGPSGAGWLMDRFGPVGFAASIAVIHAGIALFTVYRMTRRANPEAQGGPGRLSHRPGPDLPDGRLLG